VRILVKLGGSLKGAQGLLAEIADYTDPLVLVHGGGPNIGQWLQRLGFETRFHQGLRVTPPEQMEVVEMVLSTLGKALAHGISVCGKPALGLSGRDANLLQAQAISAELGRVGRVTGVNKAFIETLLTSALVPVIAPIALDQEGALNINADTAAGAIAGALGLPAVFLTDVQGVYAKPTDPQSRFAVLTRQQIEDLKTQGIISGGMIPKVEAALYALEQGSPWSVIVGGQPSVLQGVLEGVLGTRVVP
jgi:acetylglutamate kinase